MTLEQTLDYIHSLERFGSKPGLERISALLEALGRPQDKLKFVHVAGTNGKGSTASMIAYALQAAGYKTGLYISPYVLEFRERMQINGQMIAPQSLAQAVQVVKDCISATGEDNPTEFEVITAAALWWYAQERCDVVVLEVGLGGRFDATNVISPPLAAVITAIDLDHTQVLGDTVEQIAAEKCGIIKPGTPVISYPDQHPEALAVIMEHCAMQGSRLVMGNLTAAEVKSCTLEGSDIVYRGHNLHIPLVGAHQIANCITAVETLTLLAEQGWPVTSQAIVEGISRVRLPARMEILSRNPLVVLDGAHNLAGARVLEQALEQLVQGRKITAVAGMLSDKDWKGALRCIAPHLDSLYTVAPPNPRALPATQFAETAAQYCRATPCATLEQALQLALAERADALLIWGSLYLAAEMRELVLRGLPET